MHVSPSDIRYAIVGLKRIEGKLQPGILQDGYESREAAIDKCPSKAYVIAYVSHHRRHYPRLMRDLRAA